MAMKTRLAIRYAGVRSLTKDAGNLIAPVVAEATSLYFLAGLTGILTGLSAAVAHFASRRILRRRIHPANRGQLR
jgi:hypothetical protein